MMKNHQKIFMYHGVGSSGNKEAGAGLYSVPVEQFREQMEYIVHRPSTIDYRQVLITFDDGLLDNYTVAYPVLKELRLKAYFFVIVGKVDKDGCMSWQQLKELKDAGMIIGSHGMEHKLLTQLNDAELDYELRQSKKILEENLGCKVEYLSIPRGFCNNRIINRAKEIGYKAVFTSDYNDNDGFRIGRIAVKKSWSLGYFKQVLKNGLSFTDKTKELVKSSSKRFLGAKLYDKIRTNLIS